MGRFVTTDPLGYVDGPNLYQYGLNNPVNFADPMGDRIRFRRVDNEDQIGALSAEERSLIEAELGAFIGADFSIDPETGELFLETVRPDASEFGVKLLSYLAADLTRDFEVFVYDHGFVDIAGSVSGVQREPAPVFLDLGDITGAEHQVVPLSMSERLGGILGKTEEGLEDFTTGGVGAFLVHELVHSDTGLDDPERERMGQVTGPVVDLVNIIREERGFLLRGPGYYERREGQSLNRIVMSFTNAEDKVRARVIFKSFILARDGARHKGWCEKENKRAAKEGRRSRCIGSRVFNQ